MRKHFLRLFFYYASGYYKLARYSQSGFLSTKESVMFFLTCQCHLRHASAISGYYKLARYSQSGLPSTKKIRNLDFWARKNESYACGIHNRMRFYRRECYHIILSDFLSTTGQNVETNKFHSAAITPQLLHKECSAVYITACGFTAENAILHSCYILHDSSYTAAIIRHTNTRLLLRHTNTQRVLCLRYTYI